MSPPVSATDGRDDGLKKITEFALDLQSQLQGPSSRDLLAGINRHAGAIRALSRKGTRAVASDITKELEKQGRGLWNTCIRLKGETGSDREDPATTRAMLLAFCMIELGRSAGGAEQGLEPEAVYLMQLAAALARTCLREGDVEGAREALRKAAEYIEKLKGLTDTGEGNCSRVSRMKRLEADYLALRMILSWRENRIDVALHMLSKVEALGQSLDVASVESTADALRQIGAGLFSKGDYTTAAEWLRRAYRILNSQALDRLSVSGVDIWFVTCQDLIQSLLQIGSDSAVSEAGDLVSYAENAMGQKPVILHWKLQLLKREDIGLDIYGDILKRMELQGKGNGLGSSILDELIRQHLSRAATNEWLNKAVVWRTWMSTEGATPDSIAALMETMSAARGALKEPLTLDVVGAAHMILWKKIESEISTENYEVADKYCLVALHDIFANSAELTKAKFGRRRIICALGLKDPQRARDAFRNMPDCGKNDPLTRYLLFKASLLDWDTDLGRSCIDHLANHPDRQRSQDMLYACIREAQAFGDKLCTLAALKAVALTWDPARLPGACLTSVLRCSIRLIGLIEEDQKREEQMPGPPESLAEDACQLFETAARWAKQNTNDKDGNGVFDMPELHWFRKNAYNIGVTKCGGNEWDLLHIVRVLNSCLDFITCYPDVPEGEQEGLVYMEMRCNFVNAAALASLARTEDSRDGQLRRYAAMRRHIAAFWAKMEDIPRDRPHEVADDLTRKSSTLYVFDFEGTAALGEWDDLAGIVKRAEKSCDEVCFKAMGDCLLRSSPPGQVFFTTMRLIVNQIFKTEQFDSDKLARYIRCIFQAALPLDDAVAMQVLDQAVDVSRQCAQVSRPFPPAELEWLAVTAFNRAVDLYARGRQGPPCHRWALRALELAGHMDDGGRVGHVLQSKFASLRFPTMER